MTFDKLKSRKRETIETVDEHNRTWEIKKLGEVCQVQRGLTYSGKDTVDFSDQVVLRATNINLGARQLIFDDLKYLRDDLKIKPIYALKKHSLLICFSSGSKSHLGKIALIEDDYPNFYFGGFIGQITPSDKIDSKYLFYYLSTEAYKVYISNLTDGVNINNLKINDLKSFEIPLPPLPEQQRIVAILDETFSAIDKAKANAEQNLKNAKELFESYLQGVFENGNWEKKKWNNVLEIRSGRNQKEVEDPNGEYPILGSAGKVMGYANNFICEEGTTIVGRKGTINNPMYIEEKFWNVDTAFGLHALNQLNKRFLFYFCRSYDFTKQDKGSGRPSLVKSDLLQIEMPIPLLDEQQTIVRQLDALRAETQKLEAVYQQKIDDLEELKKSILQKAFAGELKTEKVFAV